MNQTYRNATLGDVLRERRTTLGMSMRDVAGTALSPTAINNIEKGKINPTVETVLYLCLILHLQPEQALLFYPDCHKSAPALFERVDELLADKMLDEAVLLLYDMYWAAIEQESCDDLIAEIQCKLAVVFSQLGRFEQARSVMLQAYKHFLAVKNVEKQIDALQEMGSYLLHTRQIPRSISNLTEAVDLAHRYQVENTSVALAYTHLAEAYLLQDRFAEALSFNREAEALYKRLQDADGIARNALQQSKLLAHLNETSTAYEIAKGAYEHFERTQNDVGRSDAALVVGDILCQLEDFNNAESCYLQALHVRSRIGVKPTFPIEYRLASLKLKIGDDQAARTYAQVALENNQCPTEQSNVYHLLAQCDLQTGDLEGYIRHMEQACTTLKKSGLEYAAALLQCELADEINDFTMMRNATQILRKLHASYQSHTLD